jgi:ornithine carbamoyltransferase
MTPSPTASPATPSLAGRDLLVAGDLDAAEATAILDLAARIRRDDRPLRSALDRKSVVLLFEKPSLRTRVSFEIGIGKLGGRCVYLDHQANRIGERESIADYARNLERWTECLVLRTHEHRTIEEMAAHASIPVVNALSEIAHPCQALADFLTLREHGLKTSSLRLAFVGDGNNVCRSLMELSATLGASFVAITPEAFAPPADAVAAARARAARSGGSIELAHDLAAVRGADAVYTDAWISMGQAAGDEKRRAMRPFQVNAAAMSLAGPRALFLHCLPAHRGEEVTDEVMDGPRSVVFDQAENRMHAQNALLLSLLLPAP